MALELGEPSLEAKDGNTYLFPGGGGGVGLQRKDGEVGGNPYPKEPLSLEWPSFEEVVCVRGNVLSHIGSGGGGESVELLSEGGSGLGVVAIV